MSILAYWIAAGLAVALAVWLIVPVWAARRFELKESKDRAEIEDNYRKTVGQAIGAIAIIATFAWTFVKDSDNMALTHREFDRQVREFRAQQKQTLRQFNAQVQQFQAQQRQASRQFANQQFIAAATLLKEQSVGTRIAGLYGLQQIAAEQPGYHFPAIYAAIGFIRNPGTPAPGYRKDIGWPLVEHDTQSAIAILADLDADNSVKINLDGAYLVGGNFSSKGQNGAFADSSFQGARLYAANFRMANVESAEFGGAYMADWEAYGDEWDGLSADDYDTGRSHHVVDFAGARLANARFDHATIGGGIFDGACLAGAKFWQSDLSRATFLNASLGPSTSCVFEDKKAHFYEATLIDAKFDGVDVGGVNFERANLSGADFSKALNVEQADFRDACMDRTMVLPASVHLDLAPCKKDKPGETK